MSALGVFRVIVFTGILSLVYCFLRFSRELSSKHGRISTITRLPDHSETMGNTGNLSGITVGSLSFALHTLAHSKAYPPHLPTLTMTGPFSIASSKTIEEHFSVLRGSFSQAINPGLASVLGTLRRNSTEVRDMI